MAYTPISRPVTHPLPAALAAAVQLRILEWEIVGRPDEDDIAHARSLALLVAEKGDRLLFGGKPGEAAIIFNGLVEAIAILAFSPGGITILGQHWEEPS